MSDIQHRISIDASPQVVHELVSSTEGIARWWTGRPVTGDSTVGSEFATYFGDADTPAAVFRMAADTAERVEWLVVGGMADWVDTRIVFDLRPAGPDHCTLLFRHAGWSEPNEFMAACTTNWGAYLTSLKHGAETGAFAPFPQGEISR
jgi:hypothetical protein